MCTYVQENHRLMALSGLPEYLGENELLIIALLFIIFIPIFFSSHSFWILRYNLKSPRKSLVEAVYFPSLQHFWVGVSAAEDFYGMHFIIFLKKLTSSLGS